MDGPTLIQSTDLLENEHQLNVFCSLEKFTDNSEREHDAPVQDFLPASIIEILCTR